MHCTNSVAIIICPICRDKTHHDKFQTGAWKGNLLDTVQIVNNCLYTSSAAVSDTDELFDPKNIAQLQNMAAVHEVDDDDDEYLKVKQEISAAR